MAQPVVATPLARKLREALARKRRPDGRLWTHDDLAKAVGVERNTVQGWLNRGAEPREIATRKALVTVLEVPHDWLFGDDQIPIGAVLPPIHAESVAQLLIGGSASGTVSGPGGPGLVSLPRQMQAMALRFEAECVETKGATEADLAYIRRALHSPETVLLFESGYEDRPLSAEEQVAEMELLTSELRDWLKKRIQLRRSRA